MAWSLPKSVSALAKAMHRPATRFFKQLPGFGLIALAILISILFINKASERKLSDLENIQFQVITMGIGLLGSYWLGSATARESAMDIVRPHAKSAFRRVLSLYASLGRLNKTMEKVKPSLVSDSQAILAIERFQDLVIEQINTSGDTIEDWGDIVPDEVAKIKEKTALLEGLPPNQ